MSSTTLAKIALCQDTVDYESLLASLSLAKELLDCDSAGNTAANAATQIFEKLFNDEKLDNMGMPFVPAVPNVWYFTGVNTTAKGDDLSCFKDLGLYYYDKSCGTASCPFKPVESACINVAIALLNNSLDGSYEITIGDDETGTFAYIADAFAAYLSGGAGVNLTMVPLDDVMNVVRAFCEILIQRVSARRYVRKVALSVNECDL